jgi:hypothetical protein
MDRIKAGNGSVVDGDGFITTAGKKISAMGALALTGLFIAVAIGVFILIAAIRGIVAFSQAPVQYKSAGVSRLGLAFAAARNPVDFGALGVGSAQKPLLTRGCPGSGCGAQMAAKRVAGVGA